MIHTIAIMIIIFFFDIMVECINDVFFISLFYSDTILRNVILLA